ncbi:hypothetical protein T9H88_12680 [Staphylococcus aureus]|nr:hypothetical protein T9H88_12680 [Staphylococcus aureus]
MNRYIRQSLIKTLKLKVRIIADSPTGYSRLDKKSEKRGIKMTVQVHIYIFHFV